MQSFFLRKKYLLLAIVLSLGVFGYGGVHRAHAACTINSLDIRPHGVQPIILGTIPSVNDFPGSNNPNRNEDNGYPEEGYDEENPNFPPLVYADVSTSGCDGTTFTFVTANSTVATQLATIQSQGFVDPIQAYVLMLISQFTDASNPFAINSQIFVGPSAPQPGSPYHTDSDNFTIVMNSGEKGCAIDPGTYDCNYIFGIFAQNVQGYIRGTQTQPALLYECDSVCFDDWQFLQIIPYQQSLSSDVGGINLNASSTIYFTEGYDNYLAPLPGLDVNQSSTLGGFLKSMFTVLIILAGLLAFIMIVLGAITYATTDSFSGSEHGREMIMNAILGLVIALGAWIILNAINPNLASNLSITIPKANFNPVFEPDDSVGEGVDEITVNIQGGGQAPVANCDASQMVEVSAFGHTFKIYQGLVSNIQAVSAQWQAAGGDTFYHIDSIGGYNCRRVRGTNSWSAHAFGMAVDINPKKNPFGPNLVTDMPPAFVQMWTSHGWGWGGNWSSKKDAMHFSKYPPSEGGDGVVTN